MQHQVELLILSEPERATKVRRLCPLHDQYRCPEDDAGLKMMLRPYTQPRADRSEGSILDGGNSQESWFFQILPKSSFSQICFFKNMFWGNAVFHRGPPDHAVIFSYSMLRSESFLRKVMSNILRPSNFPIFGNVGFRTLMYMLKLL